MDSSLSEEELDKFLKDAGILAAPAEPANQLSVESIEKLVDEIIGTPRETEPSSPEPRPLPLLFQQEKAKKNKFGFLPLGLSIAFLGGVLLGTCFGYFWGSQKQQQIFPIEEIQSSLSRLIQEVETIRSHIHIETPPSEIIEPLNTSDEISTLAPEALT